MASPRSLASSNALSRRRILLSHHHIHRPIAPPTQKHLHTSPSDAPSQPKATPAQHRAPLDIAALLSTPTWSITALLPPRTAPAAAPIPPAQLQHLLRLSALPAPADAAAAAALRRTLAAQLHFVRRIRAVDARAVQPLRAVRDESAAADREREVTLGRVAGALEQEERVGRWGRRVRRSEEGAEVRDAPAGWEPLRAASRTAGRFFVVDVGKGEGEGEGGGG